MNERFALETDWMELAGQFHLDRILYAYDEQARIAPTGQIPVILTIGNERCLSDQRWGLMPYWGKSSIHAERDALQDRPYLRRMLSRKRCVVPCSSLYYDRTDGKNSVTYKLRHADKKVFGAAGIYDVWLDSEKNEYPMCTIISTRNPAGDGHVPLVLEGDALDEWLAPETRAADALNALLRSLPEPDFRIELADPTLMF